jgi:surface antigen
MSRWRRPLAVALVSVGLAAVVPASAGGNRDPLVYGYPYAARCPAAGLAKKVDRWGMFMCNCTSYVAWALEANRQRIDWFIPGAMDARNWAHVARLRGIRTGRRARVGAVAVWPNRLPPFGHVAYVMRVAPSGLFDVAEYNYPHAGFGRFVFGRRWDVSPVGATFVYVPRRSREAEVTGAPGPRRP